MKLVSLFSGCGGMDIGFEGGFSCLKKSINENIHNDWISSSEDQWATVAPTNFKTVFANDIKPAAKAAWVSFFEKERKDANEIYHLDSIVNLVKKEYQTHDVFPKNIDILTGGFPCQDFSIAGKRLGFESHKSHTGKNLDIDEPSIESRGQLYMWMREVINITQPKLFIAENVKGLTNLKDVKEIIEHDFSQAGNGGYLVVPAKVLNAQFYGVPQSRERVIFFGFKKSALTKKALTELKKENIIEAYDPYPLPTHGKENLKPIVTCAEAFVGLQEPEFATDTSQQKYSKAKYMGGHCQGQVEIKLDSVGPTIRSEHHGNIEFRRLNQKNGGKYIDELAQGMIERRLTIRECARLQTFPDNYQFILSKTSHNVAVSASSAYKIIGNAVPCLLAYNIAKNLEKKWNLYFKQEEK
ncbi:DNA (cytosine-5-)-methyltransferase [Avibacterium paragallinarum]|uniref:DNA cytosine methyltransferase n=1 Tax=Avibacterium paragallinarum TaxID=728 RepID=UPI002ED7B1A9